MNSDSRKSDINKYLSLVKAALDYQIEHNTGHFVLDGVDSVKDYFLSQKAMADRYYKQGNLNKLHKQFHKLIETARNNIQLDFPDYLLKKTGYSVNIFADWEETANAVLTGGRIEEDEEAGHLNSLAELYRRMGIEEEKQKQLESLVTEYFQSPARRRRDDGSSRVVKREERNGEIIETTEITFGASPNFNQRKAIDSPNGDRSLRLTQWISDDGLQSITGVDISLSSAGGGIYAVNGIHPEINAFWKDNDTIVIQTSKDFEAMFQHRIVESKGQTLKIEYDER